MNGFDWVIVAIFVLSVLLAVAQGFFFEAFSLGGMVLGYLLAAWEYRLLAAWYEPYVKSEALANACGFMTIFFIVVVLSGIAGKVTRWMMKEAGLSWVDRMLGAAFGLLRGMVMVTVMVVAATSFSPESQWLKGSQLSGYFVVGGRFAAWLAPEELRTKFKEGVEALRQHRMDVSSPGGTPGQQTAAPAKDGETKK